MRLLIDGYNLLFAIGLANRSMTNKALERARTKLLDWLSESHAQSTADVLVVFDALNAPHRKDTEQVHRQIRVQFTVQELADDRIEDHIRQEPQPKQLIVISNDSRIQQAAQRRGCPSWTCSDYVDWLLHQEHPTTPIPEPDVEEKAITPSEEELQQWLSVFDQTKPKRVEPQIQKSQRTTKAQRTPKEEPQRKPKH